MTRPRPTLHTSWYQPNIRTGHNLSAQCNLVDFFHKIQFGYFSKSQFAIGHTLVAPHAAATSATSAATDQLQSYVSECIRVGHLNVNRLLFKVDYIRKIILDRALHLLAITETWLTDDVSDGEVNVPDFHFFRKDRF